jgi:hydroxyacylglutathione hydrolase
MDTKLTIERLVVGSLSANCYIVGEAAGKTGMVIDPGGHSNRIIQAIDASGLDIRIIALTHGHSDHIAALYEIQEHTGAAVAVHVSDAAFLEGREAYSSQFGISYRTPDPPDILFHDGDVFKLRAANFTVIHTPGHTPGSISLHTAGKVFTGDSLFRKGIGTTMMPGSSRGELLKSIRTRLMLLPDETVIYPGHGRETTIGAERRDNPWINGRRENRGW